MKPLVGVDFDDILYDFYAELLKYHGTLYGTSYTRDQLTNYEVQHLWGGSLEDAVRVILKFYASEFHLVGPVVEGAKEGIAELQKIARMVIVTSRPQEAKDVTHLWLDQHFPGVFEDVIFTNGYSITGGKRTTKAEISQQLGIKAFLEDSIANARNISSVGVPVILFDAPWNQEEGNELITRVYSWKEIPNAIKKVL